VSEAALLGRPATRFALPTDRSAAEPPEARGLARDGVRLLVARPGFVHHAVFADVGRFLRSGDLLLVNTSATLPAAVDGRRAGGERIDVHFSTRLDDGSWIVELRAPDRSGPILDGAAGETVELAEGAPLVLLGGGPRLWRADPAMPGGVEAFLRRWGRPIAYGYSRGRRPLSAYQTIFAREPGSAEMPSAARPFTRRMVTDLAVRGVAIAPVLLHCGVSSPEAGEPPQAERFGVPERTARLVAWTREQGGRVIAVGTTATRAIETAADADGAVHASEGWTDVVVGPDRPVRVVDGLITGWHAPEASHLLLLEAVAGPALVSQAYEAALEAGYLWHEFGDSCLLLPEPSDPGRRT
jgi:S-adenosylmethionine:tRNA ribosyltransferase-isomerase